jgi:hypothetical protein
MGGKSFNPMYLKTPFVYIKRDRLLPIVDASVTFPSSVLIHHTEFVSATLSVIFMLYLY